MKNIYFNPPWDAEHNESIVIDESPEICPSCGLSQVPDFIDGRRVNDTEVHLVYQCINIKCRILFIACYKDSIFDNYIKYKEHPVDFSAKPFDEIIEKTSLNFIQIYHQSFKAERIGLDQIAGPGYRKALEYLIKDYVIIKNQKEIEEIKKMNISTCIEKYIDDVKIKKCASRAVWIGNDETHYERKWVEKDINDMKILIDLTVMWIMSNVLTDKYEVDMPR